MTPHRLLTLAALFLLAAPTVCPADPPTQQEIDLAIRRLAADDFGTRERATRFLWKAGRAAEPALRGALAGDNLEVVERARTILENFRYGIYPDTPQAIIDLVHQFRQERNVSEKAKIIQQLLGQGTEGAVVATRLIPLEPQAPFRRHLWHRINSAIPKIVADLAAGGQWAALDDILERRLESEAPEACRDYAAFHLLRGDTDDAIARWQKQPESALRQTVLAQLYRAKGDLQSALKAAESAGQPDLPRQILWQQGNWGELAGRDRPGPFDQGNIDRLGYLAFYQRKAGKGKDLADTLARIRRHAEGKADDSSEVWFAAEVLFLLDRPAEAIDLFRTHRRYTEVYEILARQSRFPEAFGLVDQARKEDYKDLLHLESLHGRTLTLLGDRDAAEKLYARLGAGIAAAERPLDYAQVVEDEAKAGLTGLAHEHCLSLFPRLKKSEEQVDLLRRLYPADRGEEVALWWEALLYQLPAEEYGPKFQKLRDLLAGKITGKDLADLTDAAAKAGGDKLQPAQAERRLHTIADTCLAAGDAELARTYLDKAAGLTGSPSALTRLGDFHADREQWPQAADKYAAAWQAAQHADTVSPVPLYLQGWALVRAGRKAEGDKLIELAHWVPLAGEELRYGLAEAMEKRGDAAGAWREREFNLRLGEPLSWYHCDAFRESAYHAAAGRDYLKAADDYERFVIPCVETSRAFTQVTSYLFVMHRLHLFRAQGLLRQGKDDEARREIDLCLELLPAEIDFAIALVPELEERGDRESADRLFAAVLGRWQDLCREYPASASCHNKLAWLGAACRRRLDLALTHAKRAVELEPGAAAYLDTLAEVHFQKGETPEAVRLMRECLRLEPGRDYYARQLRRFEKGDPLAPIPE